MRDKFTFSSSIASDVWHPKNKPEAYEWWYFDALSDDGSEAIVITFLDNYIFSPQYNSRAKDRTDASLHTTNGHSSIKRFPAIAFVYYRDGKAVYRAISEYPSKEFQSDSDVPGCKIGKSSFRFEAAPYGTGYVISIDTKLGKNKRIKANFEWLSIESDFVPQNREERVSGHSWNLVAPRSDVTGKITVETKRDGNSDEIIFRGTGYHDHNLDDRWLPDTLKSWQRGRVHFPDSTAVFYRYLETESNEATTKLFIVRDGKLSSNNAVSDAQEFSRNLFRLKYPSRLQITDSKKTRLKIKQSNLIESSFFYLRFLSEMTLSLGDGKPRKGIGITEHLAPKALKYRWLDWLTGVRIDK